MTHGRSVARSDGAELELAALRGRVATVEAELVAARATRDQLAGEVERLRVDNQRLRARVGELAAQVGQLRRASKRQAAPFSKGTVAPHPRRPGRQAGTAYGHHARRPVPTPTGSAGSSTLGCLRPAALWRCAQRRAGGLPVAGRPPPLPATQTCR